MIFGAALWIALAGAAEFGVDYSEFAALNLRPGVRTRLVAQAEEAPWAHWMRVWNDTFVDPPVEMDCAADLTDRTYFRRRLLGQALTITSWGDPKAPPPQWALRNLGLMVGLAMYHESRLDLASMDRLLETWIEALERRLPGLDVDRFLAERDQRASFVSWVEGLGEVGRVVGFGPIERTN